MKEKNVQISERQPIYYSCVYSGGIYEFINQTIPEPYPVFDYVGESPMFRNMITGQVYYARCELCSRQRLIGYQERVLCRPKNARMLWPVDLIYVPDSSVPCSAYSSSIYDETNTELKNMGYNTFLLFEMIPTDGYVNGFMWLSRFPALTHTDFWIRQTAISIVTALKAMNQSGFIYPELHPGKLLFNQNGEVFFNYSALAFAISDEYFEVGRQNSVPRPLEIPPEFAEPALILSQHKNLDLQSQNYSLAALLFYLFMGRHAYDGRLLSGYTSGSKQSYYVKFRDYMKMPVFIFDETDKQNGLMEYESADMEVIQRWNSLDPLLKRVFTDVLKQSNATRKVAVDNPGPEQWLLYFNALGWNRTGQTADIRKTEMNQ